MTDTYGWDTHDSTEPVPIRRNRSEEVLEDMEGGPAVGRAEEQEEAEM